MNNINYINKEEVIYTTIKKLGEKSNIIIEEKEKRGNRFYDVKLVLDQTEKFLGRFDKTNSIFSVEYKDGKILICNRAFDNSSKTVGVKEVLSLYEIVDDLFYSCSQKQALELFDKDMDNSFLMDKDEFICRLDTEKRKRYNRV